MTMKTLLSILVLLTLCLTPAFGQDAVRTDSATGLVTIMSRGKDVRDVLYDLFTQSKKNYVVEQVPRTELYLVLSGVEFEEALQVVCRAANLVYEVENGIYSLRPNRIRATPINAAPPKPKGKLPESALLRKITTKFIKTDLRQVIANIAQQSNLRIEIDPAVPQYKLDAVLKGTTVKYGLELLTSAIGCEFILTDEQSILIRKPNQNRVVLQEQAAPTKH